MRTSSSQGQTVAMAAAVAPAALAVKVQPHDETFLIGNRHEVHQLLESLRQARSPVVISSPQGTVVCTTLWGLDEPGHRLNFNATEVSPQLDSLVESDEAVAVAYLDAVQVQFELSDLVLVRSASSQALQTRIPEKIYRFQRREAFRVPTAQRDGPQAKLRHPALPDMHLNLRVLDVSLGGCALWLPVDVPALEPGNTLSDVRIELDPHTHFTVQLSLRHVVSMGHASVQERGVRIGCAWRPNNPAATRTLQRWIDQSQKRMRLLHAG